MTFPCTSCGSCCRRVLTLHPDWPVRPDGACIQLSPDNSCMIYETRPLICRMKESRPPGMTFLEWYGLNVQVCNKMQREDGVPESFRPKLEAELDKP